jgi:TonB-dependent SusC/RagA subfamily outer membrane receptor
MAPSISARPLGTRAAGATAGAAAGVLAALAAGVLAAGCAPRRAATAPAGARPAAGAVGGTSVPASEIAGFRGTRVEDLIQGRIAGVHVTRTGDGDYAVRIRGARSVLGSDTPLYVIDGVQVRAAGIMSALAGVAPQSVERIEVLKDAGATSIYGVLGGNGVIVVTTKRGQR